MGTGEASGRWLFGMIAALLLTVVLLFAVVAASTDTGDEDDPASSSSTSAGSAPALVPGQPCALGSHRDCIDFPGEGAPIYLIGGGECMETFAPDDAIACSDFDGDGHAGYPDAGERG